jgi:hypothetical protein
MILDEEKVKKAEQGDQITLLSTLLLQLIGAG